jgi:hypothetical protein
MKYTLAKYVRTSFKLFEYKWPDWSWVAPIVKAPSTDSTIQENQPNKFKHTLARCYINYVEIQIIIKTLQYRNIDPQKTLFALAVVDISGSSSSSYSSSNWSLSSS